MNSISFSTKSFFTNSIPWTPTVVGGTALISAALAIAYICKKAPGKVQPLIFNPIVPSSQWYNPFTMMLKAVCKVFFLILTPYYLICGEKEYWMNELPSAVHYNYFNSESLTGVAQASRTNMQNLLEMMGATDFKPALANKSLPGWSGIDLESLADSTKYYCGQFYLTGQEIKNLATSVKASYDSSILSWRTLRQILLYGSSSQSQEAQARGRMVSSLVASICDARGNPLPRGENLPLYRVYTSNAPNLAYNAYDKKEFVENGALNKPKFKNEIERILLHYLKEAKANQDNVAVLCGFGLGAFMTPELLPDAKECFVEALKNALQAEGAHFEKIIFADPNKELTRAISAVPNVVITNKSCLDIAHYGAKRGYKIALFNPGDGSGIPGQFWYDGHIALEEMFGLFTTLLIGQHPHVNPKIADSNSYTPA